MKKNRKGAVLILGLVFGIAAVLTGCGANSLPEDLDRQISDTQAFLYEEIPSPQMGAIGGEWTVKGIAASGISVEEEYFSAYYDTVRAKVKSAKGNLGEEYGTEYARVILGLCAIGADPTDVEGYDLTKGLDNYDKLTEQGINGAAYALAAAGVCGAKLENENRYIKFIMEELAAEDWDSEKFLSDYLSMAILGLSFHEDRAEVKAFNRKMTEQLSVLQQEDGGMGNCVSTAEAIIALSQLGVDVFSDERFIKDGNTLADGLMTYSLKDGSFVHEEGREEADILATEKALLALDSIKLQQEGKHLYERAV